MTDSSTTHPPATVSTPPHRSPWFTVGQILLWAVALTSLALNIFVIKTLLDVRSQAGVAFDQAAGAIGTIKDGTIEYTAQISGEVPVALDVPVNFTVDVPIQETLPIETTVSVPIDFPVVGRRIITLPISTEIPIDITVTIPVSETLPINAEIPVALSVPIRLRVVDTPFGEGLGELQGVLESQATNLGAGATEQAP